MHTLYLGANLTMLWKFCIRLSSNLLSQMQAGFATMMGGNGSVMPAIPPPPPAFYPAPMVFPYGMATDRLQICPDFMMDQCSIVLCPLVHPGM